MKRSLLILGLVIVLAAGGWWTYRHYVLGPAASATATPSVDDSQAQAQGGFISASGKLLPSRWAGLSPASSGTVRAVRTVEGEWVSAATVLVELNNDVLKSQVDMAAAALEEAQAAHARLRAGATAAELAAARADVSAAEAALAQTKAALAVAQHSAAAADAQVSLAQAQYDELASRPTQAERVAAQRPIDQAAAVVKQAQAAYDRVRGDPALGARPEAAALEQATASLSSARAAAEAATQGATRPQLAVATAAVNAAKAQAATVHSQVPTAEAGVQGAQSGLARAQAALDRMIAGATPEDLAAAEAHVRSAQAGLTTAQARVAETQVSAPFDGVVGAVYARPGELALPGQPVLMLGDTRQMRVETTDLRETDVAGLRSGMPAEITFDALPGRSFLGTIGRIAPMSSAEKGSTNYTVVVELEKLDPALRWGMTAFVNVQVR